jgi:hypothetical protein
VRVIDRILCVRTAMIIWWTALVIMVRRWKRREGGERNKRQVYDNRHITCCSLTRLLVAKECRRFLCRCQGQQSGERAKGRKRTKRWLWHSCTWSEYILILAELHLTQFPSYRKPEVTNHLNLSQVPKDKKGRRVAKEIKAWRVSVPCSPSNARISNYTYVNSFIGMSYQHVTNFLFAYFSRYQRPERRKR